MRRLVAAVVPLAIWFAVGAHGSPVERVTVKPHPLGGSATKSYVVTYKAGERANVIVIGDGRTPLGLYVFDAEGNCVARDDKVSGRILDDNAVVWYPEETQPYRVEVHNFGDLENTFEIYFR